MTSETLAKQEAGHAGVPIEERVAQIEIALAGQGLRPLIQQVAWVLFFEYEKLPTGNNIYALLKQGSMTTYGSEVGAFWNSIREQVKEVQALASIPEPLAREVSRSLGEMWRLALLVAAQEKKRTPKKHASTLDKLTPLSRLSARLQALEAERDHLTQKLAQHQAERVRKQRDASGRGKKSQRELASMSEERTRESRATTSKSGSLDRAN